MPDPNGAQPDASRVLPLRLRVTTPPDDPRRPPRTAPSTAADGPSPRPLGERTARGALAMFAGRGTGLLVQLVRTVVLARLLVPDEVGIVVMVAVVTSLATILLDLGLSTATVRAPALDDAERTGLFWTNTTTGLLAGLLLVAAAPLLAAAYGDPRVAPMAVAMSVLLPLRGLAAQPAALLRRAMAFRAVASAQLAATVAGVVAAVGLAWQGYGPWALVGMHLVTGAVHLGAHAALCRRACRWSPGSPVVAWRTLRAGRLAPHLRFGLGFLGSTFAMHGARSFEAMLVGGGLGAGAAGLWQRGQVLANLPADQIRQPVAEVAQPALARVAHDRARVAEVMRRMSGLSLSAGFAIAALSFVLAEPIVRLLLGPAWLEAAPLLKWFALAAAGSALMNAGSWIFVATGHSRRLMRWAACSGGLSVFLVATALPRGAEAAAAAHALATAAVALPMLGAAARSVGLEDRRLMRTITPPVVAAVVAGLVAHLVAATLVGGAPNTPAIVVLALAGPSGLAAHVLVLVLGFGQGPLLRHAWMLLARSARPRPRTAEVAGAPAGRVAPETAASRDLDRRAA